MSSIEYDEMLMSACLKVCKIEDEKNRRYEKAVVYIPEKTELLIRKYIRLYEDRIRLGTSLKRVACIIIALMLISGVVLAVNVEARNKLLKMLRKEYGSAIEYKPAENVEVNSTVSFEVGWLPDGFELKKRAAHNNGMMKYYLNQNEESVIITAYPIGAYERVINTYPEDVLIATESGNYKGYPYELITNDKWNDYNLTIFDEENDYYIQIGTSLDKLSIFKIFDHLIISIVLD